MTPRVFAAGALLILSTPLAQAAIVYDTITDQTATGVDGFQNGASVVANSFYAPGTPDFDSITLNLSAETSDSASVMIYLIPDTNVAGSGIATAPDLSQIGTATLIGTLTDATIAASGLATLWDVNAAVSSANGVYWVATKIGGSEVDWNFNESDGGFGTGNQAIFADSYAPPPLPAADGAYQMAVDTPEPATMAILGSALAGLGFFRRRRAAKTA
jgi:hypothetical protein